MICQGTASASGWFICGHLGLFVGDLLRIDTSGVFPTHNPPLIDYREVFVRKKIIKAPSRFIGWRNSSAVALYVSSLISGRARDNTLQILREKMSRLDLKPSKDIKFLPSKSVWRLVIKRSCLNLCKVPKSSSYWAIKKALISFYLSKLTFILLLWEKKSFWRSRTHGCCLKRVEIIELGIRWLCCLSKRINLSRRFNEPAAIFNLRDFSFFTSRMSRICFRNSAKFQFKPCSNPLETNSKQCSPRPFQFELNSIQHQKPNFYELHPN